MPNQNQQKPSGKNIGIWMIYPIIGFIIAIGAFIWFAIKYIFTPHPNPPY